MDFSFKDDLPLDGKVYIKGEPETYIYMGYLVGHPNKCAVCLRSKGGQAEGIWVARNRLSIKKEN